MLNLSVFRKAMKDTIFNTLVQFHTANGKHLQLVCIRPSAAEQRKE